MRAGWLALLVTFGVSGCSTIQSALHPVGPEAGRILDLTWVLFALAAFVTALVLGSLAVALFGPRHARRRLASGRTIVALGIVFPVVTLTALLGYGLWVMRENTSLSSETALEVEVTGEQWWWRVAYRLPGGAMVASANEVRIPTGREVRFALRSADVIHSFWVPSLAGKLDMIPGRTNHLSFSADRPGVYRGQCAEYCGGAHALMAFDVVVMPAAEFDAWLAAQPAALPAAADPEARRGGELFVAAGCGGCHTVRGTAADGTTGPDLSRVGERRTIAAATLPNTPDNLARFIAEPSHIKPGVLMPPFTVLSEADRRSISLYLTGLK
jgi:cytochrome c oxidase subunit II